MGFTKHRELFEAAGEDNVSLVKGFSAQSGERQPTEIDIKDALVIGALSGSLNVVRYLSFHANQAAVDDALIAISISLSPRYDIHKKILLINSLFSSGARNEPSQEAINKAKNASTNDLLKKHLAMLTVENKGNQKNEDKNNDIPFMTQHLDLTTESNVATVVLNNSERLPEDDIIKIISLLTEYRETSPIIKRQQLWMSYEEIVKRLSGKYHNKLPTEDSAFIPPEGFILIRSKPAHVLYSNAEKAMYLSKEANTKQFQLKMVDELNEAFGTSYSFNPEKYLPQKAVITQSTANSFFHKSTSQCESKKSCLKPEKIKEIQNLSEKLNEDLKTCWYHEDRIRQKRDGLNQLIIYSYEEKSIEAAINRLENEGQFPELRAGFFSKRVANLIGDLLASEGVINTSFLGCC
ncbi:MAG: hypothetical protein H0U70_04110 [Tatlockia sp.]|nr:hypothetical protein [Tatlockia sp.]